MENIDEIIIEAVSSTNTMTTQDLALASRKLASGRLSPQAVRESVDTELTSINKEAGGSPSRSDKGGDNSSPSQRSSKKRKHDEISNTENAQTDEAASCTGDSVESASAAPMSQQGSKRMKMNDGEAHMSPAKAQSPQALPEGSKKIEGSAAGSMLASKYLKEGLSAGNSKQHFSALDL